MNGVSWSNDAILTNGFSTKLEDHEHAIAIHYMFYDFSRVHPFLLVTLAMETGISDHVWSIDEIIAVPNFAE
jgi:hypothetical protein